jgi:hypothetical protein
MDGDLVPDSCDPDTPTTTTTVGRHVEHDHGRIDLDDDHHRGACDDEHDVARVRGRARRTDVRVDLLPTRRAGGGDV